MPHGSILGPLLFIICTNDILFANNLFKFIIYVDDATLETIYIAINKSQNGSADDKIIMESDHINDWLKCNKLSLNIGKSKYMIFYNPKKKVDKLHIKTENTYIERVEEFDFLGVIINENLNWKANINKIANKISKSMGILNRLKHFLPFSALILSHLNFGILAWGHQCERIIKLQKKIVRISSLSKYNVHTELIFISLKLFKLTNIWKLHELKFYYKYKNNKLP